MAPTAQRGFRLLRWARQASQATPQYTFPEAKAAVAALTDAPLGRGWTELQGEAALRHSRNGAAHEVKFEVGPLAKWLGLPNTSQTLWDELRRLGLPPALLFHVCLGHLLRQAEPAPLSLDGLIADIGWQPRSISQRLEMRRKVWRWLTVFEGWTVIGRRTGTYRDPLTKRIPELWVDSALFRVLERSFVEPEQLALDGSAPPFEVTLATGTWLANFRGNHQVLTYFADVGRIAQIAAGKPAGAWAQAIGLALQQAWREGAARAQVARVGEAKTLTARTRLFTRRYLLDLFTPQPAPVEVLASKNPARAKQHWKDAIAELHRVGIVRYYKELEPLCLARQDWQETWLDQQVDIRPGAEGTAAISEIASRARAAQAAGSRRRGNRGQ